MIMELCLSVTFLLLLFSSVDAHDCDDKGCAECPFSVESSGLHWSYSGEDGPSYWSESYPECGGSSQSPINIDTAYTTANYSWNSFTFQDYDVIPSSMKILNNGHTVKVSAEMNSSAILSGGGLGSEYSFQQLHFHWGKDDKLGSEHKVNGNSYPNEIHLVHYKTSNGRTDMKQNDGIAVLGILLEIDPTSNSKLNSIIDGLDSVQSAEQTVDFSLTLDSLFFFLAFFGGSESSIIPFALSDLLPDNRDDFYRYMGSLTTPPCSETVVWTVFKEPVLISEHQLIKFRHLHFEDGLKMVDNFRPDQPLNDRTVQ